MQCRGMRACFVFCRSMHNSKHCKFVLTGKYYIMQQHDRAGVQTINRNVHAWRRMAPVALLPSLMLRKPHASHSHKHHASAFFGSSHSLDIGIFPRQNDLVSLFTPRFWFLAALCALHVYACLGRKSRKLLSIVVRPWECR